MTTAQNTKSVFTIGHSSLDGEVFAELLRAFEIDVLADVRSRPQSHRFPHFSRPDIENLLQQAGIRYLFLGEELGGRPDDPKMYRADGLVNYRVRRKSYGFQAGIERVLREMQTHTLALMCAEEDPLTCHRFLMICPELVAAGVEPQHIRKGGVIQSQHEAEEALLAAHNFDFVVGPSLFPTDRSAAVEDAYAAQAEKCAFRADPQTVASF